jgi:sugar lactone lactonase YvrE
VCSSGRSAFEARWAAIALLVALTGCGPGLQSSSQTPIPSTSPSPLITPSPSAPPVVSTPLPVEWSYQLTKSNASAALDGAAVDMHGNVFVVDAAANRLVELGPDGSLKGTWGSFGSKPGQFNCLIEHIGSFVFIGGFVAVDQTGDLYVSDTGNGRIDKLSPSGTFIASWSGPTPASPFARVVAVTSGPLDEIYATDDHSSSQTIDVFTTTGSLVRMFGPKGGPNQPTPYGAAPAGVGPNGDSYVPDDHSDLVYHYSSAGQLVGSWGGPGAGEDDLDSPEGAAVDPQGHVFVADTSNKRIEEFSADGSFLASFSGPPSGPTSLQDPETVAVDGRGGLYVFDDTHYVLLKLKLS